MSIVLVGSIPRPVGGATQHVWRLAWKLQNCEIWDIHPTAEKYRLPDDVRYAASPSSRWRRLTWLLRRVRAGRDLSGSQIRAIHFHFSAPRRLGVLGLLPGSESVVRVLTLHHGDLESRFREQNLLDRKLTRRGLQSVDRIICLSDAQAEFYRRTISIPDVRLCSASSFIAPPPFVFHEVDSVHPPNSQPATTAIVASGYPRPFYCHEEAILLVDRLRLTRDVSLHLCLYGSGCTDYLQQLQRMAAERPYVHLHTGLDFVDFLRLLSRAQLYVRPTTIDSYCLAIADALALGVPVVASDACHRHPGTTLFPTGDSRAFEAVVTEILADLPTTRRRVSDGNCDDAFSKIASNYRESNGNMARVKQGEPSCINGVPIFANGHSARIQK